MNIALIVFAGTGSRIHSQLPKQFIKINGIDLVIHTIKKFNDNPNIDEINLVTSSQFVSYVEQYKTLFHLNKINKVITGGLSRQESVRLGLEALNYLEDDNILIHDGDRPLVSQRIINDAIENLKKFPASCPYILKKDELIGLSNSGRKTILKGQEVDIQTPQSFKFSLIKQMHLEKKSINVTDDISLLETKMVKFFPGDKMNFKVTTDDDLEYLKSYFENL